jgi:hypothetical protein
VQDAEGESAVTPSFTNSCTHYGIEQSSKGGTLVIPGFPITSFDLAGPEWEDLDFITFSVPGPRGETWGVDNIRLGVASVPEPSTLALITAGALVLALGSRRQQSS